MVKNPWAAPKNESIGNNHIISKNKGKPNIRAHKNPAQIMGAGFAENIRKIIISFDNERNNFAMKLLTSKSQARRCFPCRCERLLLRR